MRSCYFSLILILSSQVNAQNSLEASYNMVHIGSTVELLLNYQKNKHSFSAGIKHLNKRKDNFPQNTVFHKTFWPQNTAEKLGLTLQYAYQLVQKEVYQVEAMVNSQFTRSSIRQNGYFPYDTLDNPANELAPFKYKIYDDYYSPVLAFETNVGLILKFNLTKSIYFINKIGLGFGLFNIRDKQFKTFVPYKNYAFTQQYSFGLGYRFKEKTRKL